MLEHIEQQQGMTIATGGVQPTVNSPQSITGIWELVTERLFPVVASGKLETNIRTDSVCTVALWEEDLDRMNGSCITFKY